MTTRNMSAVRRLEVTNMTNFVSLASNLSLPYAIFLLATKSENLGAGPKVSFLKVESWLMNKKPCTNGI